MARFSDPIGTWLLALTIVLANPIRAVEPAAVLPSPGTLTVAVLPGYARSVDWPVVQDVAEFLTMESLTTSCGCVVAQAVAGTRIPRGVPTNIPLRVIGKSHDSLFPVQVLLEAKSVTGKSVSCSGLVVVDTCPPFLLEPDSTSFCMGSFTCVAAVPRVDATVTIRRNPRFPQAWSRLHLEPSASGCFTETLISGADGPWTLVIRPSLNGAALTGFIEDEAIIRAVDDHGSTIFAQRLRWELDIRTTRRALPTRLTLPLAASAESAQANVFFRWPASTPVPDRVALTGARGLRGERDPAHPDRWTIRIDRSAGMPARQHALAVFSCPDGVQIAVPITITDQGGS